MLKNKKIFIFCLAALVLIGVAVFAAVQTDVFNSAINTVSHLFSKPINSAEDIRNAPDIVEMTETQPLDSFVRQFNQRIAEGKLQWSWTNGAICYNLRYKSDEYTVQGFLSLPDDYLEKEYPVLIYNRGGDNTMSKSGEINVHTPYQLSRMGFIVLATQHRGWGEGSGKDEMGGGDVQDVIALVDLAEKFNFTNEKIYMLGCSRGAMITYLVLGRDDRVTAAVAGAGPTDISKMYYFYQNDDARKKLENVIGGIPEEVPKEYEKRSAIYWADKINTPLLITHGTEDEVIPMQQSIDLYDKMKMMGKDVELQLYEGENHSMSLNNHIETYLQWLLEH